MENLEGMLRKRLSKKVMILIGIALVAVVVLLGGRMSIGGFSFSTRVRSMYVEILDHSATPEVAAGKATISCDLINSGDPGYVTIEGAVAQDGVIKDQAEKRIHLKKNQQATVSFDLDVEGPYEYRVQILEIEPD